MITSILKCDEITYPFPNFISAAVEVWEWIRNFIPLFVGYVYLPMLGLKVINVSEGASDMMFKCVLLKSLQISPVSQYIKQLLNNKIFECNKKFLWYLYKDLIIAGNELKLHIY